MKYPCVVCGRPVVLGQRIAEGQVEPDHCEYCGWCQPERRGKAQEARETARETLRWREQTPAGAD